MPARKPIGKFKWFYIHELGEPGATGLGLGLFGNVTEDGHSQNTLLSAFLRELKIKVFHQIGSYGKQTFGQPSPGMPGNHLVTNNTIHPT